MKNLIFILSGILRPTPLLFMNCLFCVAESLVSALLFFPPYQSLVNLNQSIAVFNISTLVAST